MPDVKPSESTALNDVGVLTSKTVPVFITALPVAPEMEFIPDVFTKNKPENLTSEEVTAISVLEKMGCLFYWPTDTGMIPSEYDLSFIQEKDREAVRLLLKHAGDYLRLPAIVDPFYTNEERGIFKKTYKDDSENPVYKMYLRNCLRHDRMTIASSSIDGIAYNYCREGGEKQIEIEKARERIVRTIRPSVEKEVLEVAVKFRDLTFEALQLFSPQTYEI